MKVKGYYNTVNGVFLGPMIATNEATGVASTPRYVEGVCFGEYDTDTDEFIPLTNPVIIPKNTIVEFDERINDKGQNELHVSGFVEDKGSDLVRKGSVKGFRFTPSNVETRDSQGRVYREDQIRRVKDISDDPHIDAQVETKPEDSPFKEAKHPKILKTDNLPDIDWDKLFS